MPPAGQHPRSGPTSVLEVAEPRELAQPLGHPSGRLQSQKSPEKFPFQSEFPECAITVCFPSWRSSDGGQISTGASAPGLAGLPTGEPACPHPLTAPLANMSSAVFLPSASLGGTGLTQAEAGLF